MTEEKHNKNGYLELIIGPMYSGKTSKLIEIYKQCIFCNIPVCIINHSIDTRYHETMLSTHDHKMIPCILSSNICENWSNPLNEHYNDLNEADVILINEGQFFTNLKNVVMDMVDKENKIVYICGLDGDFQRNKFGDLLELIPYCDKVTKLNSLCSQCRNGKKGIFSCRLTNETTQVVIGSDNYKPLCRSCYL